jgi:hypothetical protein
LLAFVIRVEERFSLYTMLSMILQVYAWVALIIGIAAAVEASDSVDPNISNSGVRDVTVKSLRQPEGI